MALYPTGLCWSVLGPKFTSCAILSLFIVGYFIPERTFALLRILHSYIGYCVAIARLLSSLTVGILVCGNKLDIFVRRLPPVLVILDSYLLCGELE